MENTEQKALAELKRVYYLINNGDLNQEGFTLYHTIGRILEDCEKAKSRELSESVRPVVVLPERMQSWGESDMRANTWNDCIDLFARLNPDLTFTSPAPTGDKADDVK